MRIPVARRKPARAPPSVRDVHTSPPQQLTCCFCEQMVSVVNLSSSPQSGPIRCRPTRSWGSGCSVGAMTDPTSSRAMVQEVPSLGFRVASRSLKDKSRQCPQRAVDLGCSENVSGGSARTEAPNQIGTLASNGDPARSLHRQSHCLPLVAHFLPFVRPSTRFLPLLRLICFSALMSLQPTQRPNYMCVTYRGTRPVTHYCWLIKRPSPLATCPSPSHEDPRSIPYVLLHPILRGENVFKHPGKAH